MLDSWGAKYNGDAAPGGFTILFYPDRKYMQLCRYPEDAADIILGKIARLPRDEEPKTPPHVVTFPAESEVDEATEDVA